MAGLTGLKPGNTYGQLLYIGSGNVGIEATAKQVYSGLGIASPLLLSTTQASLLGTSARIFGMTRHTTANTAGNNLTINAGGATSGATDKNGGDTYITSGIATGSGSSNIYFQTATAGAAGTADRTPSTKMVLGGDGTLSIGSDAENINGTLELIAADGGGGTLSTDVSDGLILTTFGYLKGGHSSYFYIKTFGAGSSTVPVYCISSDDTDTGIGGAYNTNSISFVVGGNEACRPALVSAANQPALYFPEITTPTAIADMGAIYFKSDNKMYCQTGDGVEHEIAFV